MARETPYRSITAMLNGLNSRVPLIVWGSAASPYYKQVPEPAPAFPYCAYDLGKSTLEHSFGGGKANSSYVEKRTLSLMVFGDSDEIEQAAAPEMPGGLFHCLDSFADAPELLSGVGFDCILFVRKGYELLLEEQREENSIMRIWQAVAEYDFWTEVKYPLSPKGL